MNKFFIFLAIILIVPMAQAHVDWNIGINLGNPIYPYTYYPYNYNSGIYITSHPYYHEYRMNRRRPLEPYRDMDRRPPRQDFRGNRGPRF